MLQIKSDSHSHHGGNPLSSKPHGLLSRLSANHKEKPESATESTDDQAESRLNILSVSSGSESADLDDFFASLPEDWADFNFHRKKSCVLSNVYSTCVTKAISHLESLQNCIDGWMLRIEDQTALPGSLSSASSSKRLLEIIKKRGSLYSGAQHSSKLANPNSLALVPVLEESELKKSQEMLSLVPFDQDKENNAEVVRKCDIVVRERPYPQIDLSAEGVLEEILLLLARLELDRKRLELKLKQERGSQVKLKSQIENFAIKRCIELPKKVQEEHDACITDITELNWHISFSTKNERKLMHNVELNEAAFEKLLQELTDIKNNTPLIEEKIKIELDLIKRIKLAQSDVDLLLKKAYERLANSEEQMQVSETKAKREREQIEADLANSKRELNKAKKRLQDAEDQFKSCVKSLEANTKQLTDNNAQEIEEKKRRNDLRDDNEKLIKQNEQIKTDIYVLQKECERIDKENKAKQATIDEISKKFEEELNQLKQAFDKKQDKLNKILKKVTEKQTDLEEMLKDQEKFEMNIEKETRNRERLLIERERVRKELEEVKKDYEKAIHAHEKMQSDQDKEMKRIEAREDLLKKQIADLKKQINDERHILGTTTARMNAEIEDYKRNQVIADQNRIQFEAKKAEMDKKLREFEDRVAGVEKRKLAMDKEIEELMKLNKTTREDHKVLEEKLRQRLAELEPIHSSKFESYDKVRERLDHIRNHSAEMNKKMVDMEESKKVMNKTIEKFDDEIEEINEVLTEVTLKHSASSDLDQENKKSLDEVNDRIKTSARMHQELIKDRTKYLAKIQGQLEFNMDLNKKLASRYRLLKYDFMDEKLKLMHRIDMSLNEFIRVKDKRQMITLQERMHSALKDYFRLQIKHGQNRINVLNVRTDENGNRITTLGDGLQGSINHVTSFLDNQIDFSQIRQQAMEKVYREELIEQQQKKDSNLKSQSLSQINEEKLISDNQLGKTKKKKTVRINLVDVN